MQNVTIGNMTPLAPTGSSVVPFALHLGAGVGNVSTLPDLANAMNLGLDSDAVHGGLRLTMLPGNGTLVFVTENGTVQNVTIGSGITFNATTGVISGGFTPGGDINPGNVAADGNINANGSIATLTEDRGFSFAGGGSMIGGSAGAGYVQIITASQFIIYSTALAGNMLSADAGGNYVFYFGVQVLGSFDVGPNFANGTTPGTVVGGVAIYSGGVLKGYLPVYDAIT